MRFFWCTKQVKRVKIDDILTESPNPLKPKMALLLKNILITSKISPWILRFELRSKRKNCRGVQCVCFGVLNR